jgi:ribonuclease P protein component
VLYILRVEEKRKRIGFSVSKKCGGAVVRNRIKRRLREICRQQAALFRPGFDAVIIARKNSGDESWQEYCQVLDELFRKSRMFLREEQMDLEG